MGNLDQVQIRCPYCGEQFEIQVEVAADDQDYVEDCIVCCRPIALHVARDDDGSPSVSVAREAG